MNYYWLVDPASEKRTQLKVVTKTKIKSPKVIEEKQHLDKVWLLLPVTIRANILSKLKKSEV